MQKRDGVTQYTKALISFFTMQCVYISQLQYDYMLRYNCYVFYSFSFGADKNNKNNKYNNNDFHESFNSSQVEYPLTIFVAHH